MQTTTFFTKGTQRDPSWNTQLPCHQDLSFTWRNSVQKGQRMEANLNNLYTKK